MFFIGGLCGRDHWCCVVACGEWLVCVVGDPLGEGAWEWLLGHALFEEVVGFRCVAGGGECFGCGLPFGASFVVEGDLPDAVGGEGVGFEDYFAEE